jgi:hypothetical protein
MREAAQPSAAPSARSAVSPEAAAILDGIKSKCASEWPDNFRMQAYCRDQQVEAIGKIVARNDSGVMDTKEGLVIRRKCRADWPNNYRMQNYCEEQQLRAFASLR